MNIELEPVYDTDGFPYPYQKVGMFTRTSDRIWGATSDDRNSLVIRDCNPNGDLELHFVETGDLIRPNRVFIIPFEERKNFLRIIADADSPNLTPLPDTFGYMIYNVITEEHSFNSCVRVGDNFISDDGYTIPVEAILEFSDKDGNTFQQSSDKFYETTSE